MQQNMHPADGVDHHNRDDMGRASLEKGDDNICMIVCVYAV